MSWIQWPEFRQRFLHECRQAMPHTVTGEIRDVEIKFDEVALTLKTVIVFDNNFRHKFELDARPLLALLQAEVGTCH